MLVHGMGMGSSSATPFVKFPFSSHSLQRVTHLPSFCSRKSTWKLRWATRLRFDLSPLQKATHTTGKSLWRVSKESSRPLLTRSSSIYTNPSRRPAVVRTLLFCPIIHLYSISFICFDWQCWRSHHLVSKNLAMLVSCLLLRYRPLLSHEAKR